MIIIWSTYGYHQVYAGAEYRNYCTQLLEKKRIIVPSYNIVERLHTRLVA